MAKRNKISQEQKKELEQAHIQNKNKKVDKRLEALIMRAEGKSCDEVSKKTDFAKTYIYELVSKYCHQGIGAIVENHYRGNHRNMSLEEEKAFLEHYREQAEQGQIIEVGKIKKAYEEKVGLARLAA